MRPDFRLGDWLVQPSMCRLTAHGRTIQVRAKVMDLLAYLAAHPGEVISKDRLLEDVWGSQAISESALTRTVAELRQALDDDAGEPRILETIPKRGYRLVAPVVPVASASAPAALAPPDHANRRLPIVAGVALVAVVVLALGGWLWVAAERPRPLPFAARDWVLIAPFENRTGDRIFDDVLEHALERELVASGFVNVVPRPRVEDVLALMKKPADERLDRALAREVALRDGAIRVVLTGTIRKVGSAYALTTEIVDPADGSVRANVTDDVSRPEHLIGRVRGQALRVRQTLGEALESIDRSRAALEKVTTPSLQALQLYSKAAALLDGDAWRFTPAAKGRYGSAEALLRKATEADPSFASAWLLLAQAVWNQDRSRSEYLALAERAVALSSTVGPAERYLIEGYTHRRRYDWRLADRSELEAAARAYEALLQFAPDHYGALIDLRLTYRDLGRADDAERVTLHAAVMRPHSPRFAVESAKIHLARGDVAVAKAIVERVLAAEQVPANFDDTIGWARLWNAHENWLRNDASGALDAARAAEEKWIDNTDLVWLAQLNAVYIGLGRFDDAVRVINRIESPSRRQWSVDFNALSRGRWDEFRRNLQPERRDFDRLNGRIGMLVIAGWAREAQWVMDERRRRNIESTWMFHADIGGQLRVAQGRYREAIGMLEQAKSVEDNKFYVDDALAVSRRAVGDLPGAIIGLERVSRSRAKAVANNPGWQVTSWLRCHVRLAELYREAGRQADADRVFGELREMFAVADADHPLLKRLPVQ